MTGSALYAMGLFALYLLLIGMLAGWLAWVILGKNKALVREDRKPNWTILLVLGVLGSFLGGVFMSLIQGNGLALRPSGAIASIAGSVAVVAIYLAVKAKK